MTPEERYDENQERLEGLYTLWRDCRACPIGEERGDSRHSVVFGAGNPVADILIVLGIPTYEDEDAGTPMQGPDHHVDILSGLLRTVGVELDETFIAYQVMCRPPHIGDNRDKLRKPSTKEIKTCKPALHSVIETVDPKVILLVGNLAYSAMKIKEEPRTFARAVRDRRTARIAIETQGVMTTVRRSAFVIFDLEYLVKHWTLEEGGCVSVAMGTITDMVNYLDTYNEMHFGTSKPDRGNP